MKDILDGLDLTEEVQKTLAERIESAKGEWIEGAKNDPDFIKKLRSEAAGKFFNSIEKVITKNLGVKPDDLEGDLTGLKRQEALLKLGLASLNENKDKTNQDLQAELVKAIAEKQEVMDNIPNLLQDERQKHYAKYVQEGILKDTLGIDTTCSEKARGAIVGSYLQENKLVSSWDNDKGEYIITTSENLAVLKDGKPLSNKEIVRLALEDADVLKKSNGSPGGGGTPPPNGTPRPTGELSTNAAAMAARFAN